MGPRRAATRGRRRGPLDDAAQPVRRRYDQPAPTAGPPLGQSGPGAYPSQPGGRYSGHRLALAACIGTAARRVECDDSPVG
jgi:hypothetical protein